MEELNDRKKGEAKSDKVIGAGYGYNSNVPMNTPLFYKRWKYNKMPTVLDFCNGIPIEDCPTPLHYLMSYKFNGVASEDYFGDSRDSIIASRKLGEFQFKLLEKKEIDTGEYVYCVPNSIDTNKDLDLYNWHTGDKNTKKVSFIWVSETDFKKALFPHTNVNQRKSNTHPMTTLIDGVLTALVRLFNNTVTAQPNPKVSDYILNYLVSLTTLNIAIAGGNGAAIIIARTNLEDSTKKLDDFCYRIFPPNAKALTGSRKGYVNALLLQ
jgi:hypothetical protein